MRANTASRSDPAPTRRGSARVGRRHPGAGRPDRRGPRRRAGRRLGDGYTGGELGRCERSRGVAWSAR